MIAAPPLDVSPTGIAVEDAQDASIEATAVSPTGLAHAVLSAPQEVVLAKRIEAGLYAAHLLDQGRFSSDTNSQKVATQEELEWLAADGQAARQEFIEQNLRLAAATARKFRGRGFSDEDLRQDAFQGLVKAVDRYDYRLGHKFSTYAVWWIRESLLSGIRDTGFVKHPEALWNQIIKVRAAKMQILDQTGDAATVEQIAGVAKVSAREVAKCLHTDVPVSSLQIPIGTDLALGDVLCDDDAVEALIDVEYRHDHTRLAGLVSALVADLDEDHRKVLVARYGLDGGGPRNLSAVGAELGLNRQTVRAREQRALQALSEAADQLASYRLLLH